MSNVDLPNEPTQLARKMRTSHLRLVPGEEEVLRATGKSGFFKIREVMPKQAAHQ